MKNPHFICIGAQKAATTWLYSQFKNHPEIFETPYKELHYFDRDASYPSPSELPVTLLKERIKDKEWLKKAVFTVLKEIRWRHFSRAKWFCKWYFSNYNDEWYVSLFNNKNNLASGDITPSYSILKSQDVARLNKINPETRLIFLIRNPIQRAWSMLRHNQSVDWLKRDLNDLSAVKEFLNSPAQELRSDYIRTIQTYLEHFSSEQILVCYYDAIKNRPAELMNEICAHIGVSKNAIPQQKYKNKVMVSKERSEIPPSIENYLKDKYRGMIEELSQKYGGYATAWHNEIYDKLHEAKTDESSYPVSFHP